MCIVGLDCHGLVDWLDDLDDRITTRGMGQEAIDLPHTVLSFESEPFDWPAEWNQGWMNQENFQEVTTSLHEDILLPGTRQVSRKRVLEPDSEIDEQLSWVHRVRVPEGYEKMIVDPPESPDEGERHLRISNDQFGGFLAALTEFTSWPQSFFRLLTTASCQYQWTHYRQMKRNLERRSLIEQADTTLGWRLSSSIHEKLFYKILSIVGYDYQVALFVCLPSTSGLVAAAKVQLASLIVSQRSYLQAFPDCLYLQRHGRLDWTYRLGLFKEHGWNSTLTMVLGVMKLILAGIAGRLASTDMDTDVSGFGFGDYVEHIKRVQVKCKLLIDAFKDAHVPALDVASFSCDEPPLTLEQYDEVLFHLGRAFLFQATFTAFDYDAQIWFTENMFTLQRLCFPQEIVDLHPWAQSDAEYPYNGTGGIYTRIKYVDEETPLMIMDLTCLPDRVHRRLNEYLESKKHDTNIS
ncbi:hypothetical protein FIE12Z_627 [Fusarium flagelliforme]|uniref:Uncharacterized protein n=1 Tax=Fusarium flagelliforme TaxID=2675880 RepID=A0A395N512_9HYPO|nr:hypothetical protein FIE12Z_627 [Fusarium flagelliforme]